MQHNLVREQMGHPVESFQNQFHDSLKVPAKVGRYAAVSHPLFALSQVLSLICHFRSPRRVALHPHPRLLFARYRNIGLRLLVSAPLHYYRACE